MPIVCSICIFKLPAKKANAKPMDFMNDVCSVKTFKMIPATSLMKM